MKRLAVPSDRLVPTKRYQEDVPRVILVSMFPFLAQVTKREKVTVYTNNTIPISHVAGMLGTHRQGVEQACGDDIVEPSDEEHDKRTKKLVPEAGFRKVLQMEKWITKEQGEQLLNVLYHNGQVMSLGNEEPEPLFEAAKAPANAPSPLLQEEEMSASPVQRAPFTLLDRKAHVHACQARFENALVVKFRDILEKVEERIAKQELPRAIKELEDEEAEKKQSRFKLTNVAERVVRNNQ